MDALTCHVMNLSSVNTDASACRPVVALGDGTELPRQHDPMVVEEMVVALAGAPTAVETAPDAPAHASVGGGDESHSAASFITCHCQGNAYHSEPTRGARTCRCLCSALSSVPMCGFITCRHLYGTSSVDGVCGIRTCRYLHGVCTSDKIRGSISGRRLHSTSSSDRVCARRSLCSAYSSE